MPKNEDGEFELILGNRQLLSVFFIVVSLLSVFFTMGYIVGRNSSRSSRGIGYPRAAKPTQSRSSSSRRRAQSKLPRLRSPRRKPRLSSPSRLSPNPRLPLKLPRKSPKQNRNPSPTSKPSPKLS